MNALLARGVCVAALGAVVVLVPPSAATAAGTATHGNVTVVHLGGPLVNASFSTTDPGGCVTTDVFVSANSGTEQDQPGTTHYAVASVQIYQYDACTDTTLRDATGLSDTLATGAFQVSNQIDQASLHTTILASDLVSGASFPVTVDIGLVGTSDIVRDHSNTNEVYPGCHIINRWKGSGRDAVATGTVSDGTTNLTPGQSGSAEIGVVNTGFEIMNCS